MLYHIIEMENISNVKQNEEEYQDQELDLKIQDEIEKELDEERRKREQEDQERDLERQEEIDQEYGDGYKCMNFCGDREDQVLER